MATLPTPTTLPVCGRSVGKQHLDRSSHRKGGIADRGGGVHCPCAGGKRLHDLVVHDCRAVGHDCRADLRARTARQRSCRQARRHRLGARRGNPKDDVPVRHGRGSGVIEAIVNQHRLRRDQNSGGGACLPAGERRRRRRRPAVKSRVSAASAAASPSMATTGVYPFQNSTVPVVTRCTLPPRWRSTSDAVAAGGDGELALGLAPDEQRRTCLRRTGTDDRRRSCRPADAPGMKTDLALRHLGVRDETKRWSPTGSLRPSLPRRRSRRS